MRITKKHINDHLKFMKSLERIADQMKLNNCSQELINFVYSMADKIAVQLPLSDTYKFFPHLKDDAQFHAYLDLLSETRKTRG